MANKKMMTKITVLVAVNVFLMTGCVTHQRGYRPYPQQNNYPSRESRENSREIYRQHRYENEHDYEYEREQYPRNRRKWQENQNPPKSYPRTQNRPPVQEEPKIQVSPKPEMPTKPEVETPVTPSKPLQPVLKKRPRPCSRITGCSDDEEK